MSLLKMVLLIAINYFVQKYIGVFRKSRKEYEADAEKLMSR